MSAQAPAASATIAYAHSRPDVSPGDSMCAAGVTAVSEFAAIGWGRNFCAVFWIDGLSGANSSGSTNSRPTRAQMAPAVCRMIALMPRPMSAISAG